MDKKLMTQDEFDNLIKKNLINPPLKVYAEKDFKYRGEDKYANYFNEATFNDFKEKNKDKFPKYSGYELNVRDKKKIPPKMASVGSSSRFCFLAFRDLNEKYGIEFECGCKIGEIKGGMSPQLDAFIPKRTEEGIMNNIYVEAKCHEIFSEHKIVMSKTYGPLLEMYFQVTEGDYTKKSFNRKNPKYGKHPNEPERIDVEMLCLNLEKFGFVNGEEETRFDIKQFLCHLMGIKTKGLEDSELIYMFFKPLCKNANLDKVFKELMYEIETVFNSSPIRAFCKKYNIKLSAIVQNTLQMETLTDTPNRNYYYLYKDKSKS